MNINKNQDFITVMQRVSNCDKEHFINQDMDLISKPSNWSPVTWIRWVVSWVFPSVQLPDAHSSIQAVSRFMGDHLFDVFKNKTETIHTLHTLRARFTDRASWDELDKIENAVKNLMISWQNVEKDFNIVVDSNQLPFEDKIIFLKNRMADQTKRPAGTTLPPAENAAFQLGRVYLREGKVEEALNVWKEGNLSDACYKALQKEIENSIKTKSASWKGQGEHMFLLFSKHKFDLQGIKEALVKGFGITWVDELLKDPVHPSPNERSLISQLEAPGQRALGHMAHRVQDQLDNTLKEVIQLIQQNPLTNDAQVNGKISEFLTTLPENLKARKMHELTERIRQAILISEMQKKGKIIGQNQREIELLEKLGYTIDEYSPYRDKELLYGLIVELVTQELDKLPVSENVLSAAKSIRAKVKELALQARLASIEISGEKAAKFQAILDFDQEFRQAFAEENAKIELQIPSWLKSDVHPKVITQMKNTFQDVVSVRVETKVNGIVSQPQLKQHFKDDSYSAETFKQKLESIKQNAIKITQKRLKTEAATGGAFLEEEIKFYQKWAPYLRAECFQGLGDSSTVLGKGTCWAINRRVEHASRAEPHRPAEDLLADNILSQDRFVQAKYTLKLKMDKTNPNDGELLYEGSMQTDKNAVATAIENNLPKLRDSEGWVYLGIYGPEGGHAISFRLNEKRNVAWIFDSNLGLFSFERPGQPFKDSVESCLNCFQDMMATFYPAFNTVNIRQRIELTSATI